MALFGSRLSARLVVPGLVLGLGAVLVAAVAYRALPTVALLALIPAARGVRVAAISWRDYLRRDRMTEATRVARWVHLSTSIVVCLSPLVVTPT